MSYQGWTNYETWACALWIDNEQGSYLERREIVQGADKEDLEYGRLADRLKDWIEASMPEINGLWSDLLRGAFSEINWQELAEAWWEEEDHDEEKNTTTCYACGLDFPDGDMINNPLGEGELCPKCAPGEEAVTS